MKYYEEQVKKQLSASPKNINVFGSQYVLQSDKKVILEVQNLFKKYKYIIKGVDDEELFKIKKASKAVLYDLNDNPILNIVPGFTKFKIYEGKHRKGQQPLVTIKFKNSTVARKFSIIYINQETKQEEILDLNCEPYYRSAGLFLGKEKEGAPMIAKFLQTVKPRFGGEKIKYSIQAVPGIDYILVIALAIFIRGRREAQQHSHRNY